MVKPLPQLPAGKIPPSPAPELLAGPLLEPAPELLPVPPLEPLRDPLEPIELLAVVPPEAPEPPEPLPETAAMPLLEPPPELALPEPPSALPPLFEELPHAGAHTNRSGKSHAVARTMNPSLDESTESIRESRSSD
jgi:hypothetical protein